MDEGHRTCDYSYDDHTPYMNELRRRARDKFSSYEDRNLYDKNSERIKPLTNNEIEYVQNENIPENDPRKCALVLRALQYGLNEGTTDITCYNTPTTRCDICYTILGIVRYHYHISERKYFVSGRPELLTFTEIPCGTCGIEHQPQGPRHAVIIIDTVFGIGQLLHLPNPNPHRTRHVEYVTCRVNSMRELNELILSELCHCPRQIDLLLAIEWGPLIISQVTASTQKGVNEDGALLELRHQVIMLMLEIVEGCYPYPRAKTGRPSTVWLCTMPYSPEFTKWYDTNGQNIYVPPGDRFQQDDGIPIQHPNQDIHRLLVIWNTMLIDINMLMMSITDIRTYAKNPLQFFAPTLHHTGIAKYSKGNQELVASATAYNALHTLPLREPTKRDLRQDHVLRPCWINESMLKQEHANFCKNKLYNFLSKHLYMSSIHNCFRTTVDTHFGPRRVALHEAIAHNVRATETWEDKIRKRPLLDGIETRDPHLPLIEERMGLIDNNNLLPDELQPEPGPPAPDIPPPYVASPSPEPGPPAPDIPPPYVASPSPEPVNIDIDNLDAPNREELPLASPVQEQEDNQEEMQEYTWQQDEVDMEIGIDISDTEDDPSEDEVIIIDSAGSDDECMETAEEVRLPPAESDNTDSQEVTSMLKLPTTTHRDEAVNTISRMMPSSPYRMENLERRMSALHTGPRVEAGTSTQEKPPPGGLSGIAEMEPRTYIEERASSSAVTTAPSVPVKLSDYIGTTDDNGAIERIKVRARNKARDDSVPSTSKRGNKRQSEHPRELSKPTQRNVATHNIPDSIDYIWDEELKVHSKIITSTCPCPSETRLFNVWGIHNIYLISHNSNCKDDPNHNKELFNNKVRQVYQQLSDRNPSRENTAIKRGGMKLITKDSGTVRRRLPDMEDDAFCDQHQWVSVKDLHRISFAPNKSPPITGETCVTSGYLSTSGMLLLLEGYINRLENLDLITHNKLKFSPALFLLLQQNLANQLGHDSKITFPADASFTPELIELKMKTVARQYNDREHDYYAPMLYNSHWYLALIKTEGRLKDDHLDDQPIQRPGRIVITFQGMNAIFCVEHQKNIPNAIRQCLATYRGQVTLRDDPDCKDIQASHNPLELDRELHLHQKQDASTPQCGLYVLDTIVQLYTNTPSGHMLTSLRPRTCEQMQAWRQRLLKDIWDQIKWDVDLMKTTPEEISLL